MHPMAQAKEGDTVKGYYTGKLDDGTVFDSSREGDPIQFEVGGGQLIGDFETAVVGMEPEETKTFTVSAADAYGEHETDRVVEVPRDQLPDHIDPEVGQWLQLKQPDGRAVPVRVSDVTDSNITLDANHPLAGKDLTFEIELVSVS
jgi:peptidylprolyl isomerase